MKLLLVGEGISALPRMMSLQRYEVGVLDGPCLDSEVFLGDPALLGLTVV